MSARMEISISVAIWSIFRNVQNNEKAELLPMNPSSSHKYHQVFFLQIYEEKVSKET